MPDINNSLATSINSQPVDIKNALALAAQINEARARTELTNQTVGYNQFLQDQGGGFRPSEAKTLADTEASKAELAGRIGNILFQDQSSKARDMALSAAKTAGIKIDPLMESHIRTAPAAAVKGYGANLQAYGKSAQGASEQNPSLQGELATQRAAGATTGEIAAKTGEPIPSPYSPKPMTQSQVDNAISTGRNADGSPRVLSMNGNIPPQPNAPAVAPGLKVKQIEAQGAEMTGNAQKNVEEFANYKQAAANSSTTKTVLKSLQDDADRVYTGKGAPSLNDARKWVQSASNLPGVGPLVKHFSGDQSDPVAAAENIRKNIGIISRTAVGDIHETAAAALENVQNSLPTEETSAKGLKIATSQMMAIEDFKQARLQAAQAWKDSHNGTLDGFSASWNKSAGPAAFVFMRLPKDEQHSLIGRLGKTDEGKRTLKSIAAELGYLHKNRLDEVVD